MATPTPGEQRTLVERYIAAYATADASQLAEIIAPSFIDHTHTDYNGPTGVAAGIKLVHEGLSDIEIELEYFVAGAESLAFLVKVSGTHTGDFLGKAPTGNRIVWKMADFVRLEDGKFAELWNVSDNLSLMLGLGARLIEH
jgi:predicted ester cyclase